MELREKIAKALESVVGYRGLEHELQADAILALPEIRGALDEVARLEQENDALWHEMKYPRD